MIENRISLKDEFYKIAGTSNVLGNPSGTPAYGYTRSSDKLQANEGSESLSRQLLTISEKARQDNHFIPLDMVYWDVWRGKDADRPEWHRLLTDVKQQKRSDTVYLDATDRLSRDIAVYYVLIHDLTRFGILPAFAKDEDDLIRHIKLAFDELELERRRYRQIQANRARATKGNVTSKYASFGYSYTEDRMMYVINEDEAQWVRQIYDWYVSGKSIKKIAQALTEQGIRTPLGRKIWSPESLRGMLRKEVYKGVFISNRHEIFWKWENGTQKRISRLKPQSEWIYLEVPALVSEQQWDEAQRILATNKQKAARNSNKHEWLLSSLVRCTCGNMVIAKRKRHYRKMASGDKKLYWSEYYTCWQHMERWRPDHCNQPKISKAKLEPLILTALEMMLMDPSLWENALGDQNDHLEHLQAHVDVCSRQITEIDAQIAELLQMALEQRTTNMRQLFVQKQKELEEQRTKYDEQLRIATDKLTVAKEAIEQKIQAEELLQSLRELGGLADLPYEMKRQVLTRLVEEIRLDTKERWFEIKGVLREEVVGFDYDKKGQLVTESVDIYDLGRAVWQERDPRHRVECF